MAEADSDSPTAAIGRTLLACRLDRGLTQEELAEAARLSVRAIRDLERGRAVPRLSTAGLLACALRLDRDMRNRLDALIRASRALRRPGEADTTGPLLSPMVDYAPADPAPAACRLAQPPHDFADFVCRQAELPRWYLVAATAADRMIAPRRHRGPLDQVATEHELPRFASVQDAIAWCDRESANLIAAARHAAATGDHTTAWQIPWALLSYFDLHKAWDEWLSAHEIGLTSARVSGNQFGEAAILTGLGLMHYYPRHFDKAIDCYQSAGKLWREAGEPRGEAAVLNGLANVQLERHDLGGAIGRYRSVLKINRMIGDQHGEGVVLNNLAEAHCELGAFDRALEYASAALAVNRETGYRRVEAFTLCHLARALAATGSLNDANARFCEAIDISSVLGDRQVEAWAFDYLGRALASAGRVSEARLHWSRAVDLFEGLGDPQATDVRTRLSARQ